MITSQKNHDLLLRIVLAVVAMFTLSASLGCGIQAEPSVKKTTDHPADKLQTEIVSELEGAWDMYSATYASIGGSSYTFNGNRVTIVTARAVGDDKINFEIETSTESGDFTIEPNGEATTLRISLDDKSKRVMEYSVGNGELHIWPEGNRGFTMSCKKRTE